MRPTTLPPFIDDSSIKGFHGYLSKKVTFPPPFEEIRCVAWNQNTNYIAAGAERGLLKVIKLRNTDTSQARDLSSIATSSEMSVNDTLEGNTGYLCRLEWNELYAKVVSTDTDCRICTWQMHSRGWMKEIDITSPSVVVDFKWSNDCNKILIVCKDGKATKEADSLAGTISMGHANGNKLYEKKLNVELAKCAWSPDDSVILVGMSDGDVHALDPGDASLLMKLHMACLETVDLQSALKREFLKADGNVNNQNIVAIKWHAPALKVRTDETGWAPLESPIRGPPKNRSNNRLTSMTVATPIGIPVEPDQRRKLVIVFANAMQLMRNEGDPNPQVVRMDSITITAVAWSPTGAFLAVCGYQKDLPEDERTVMCLLSSNGDKLRLIKTNCKYIYDCAWDPTGLKIALAQDNGLFFAHLRPEYKWGYCAHTVVYAYRMPNTQNEYNVVFYEMRMGDTFTKAIRDFETIAAHDEYCILVSKNNEKNIAGAYIAQLCNGIGIPVDFKHIDIEPHFVAMNNVAAVIAAYESFHIWHFQLPKKVDNDYRFVRKSDADGTYYLENILQGNEKPIVPRKRTPDNICSICVGDTFFLAACDSGTLYKFSLTDGSLISRFVICPSAEKLQLNCNFNRLAALNRHSTLQFYMFNEDKLEPEPHRDITEVWSYMWDSESENSIAVTRKSGMIVFHGNTDEGGVSCAGYICQFKGLAVRTVVVDSFMHVQDQPDKKYVTDIEIKILREAKEKLTKISIAEATKYIEQNPHPRLWSLLAEHALKKLDVATAEHAYVMLKDYTGIMFCKKLNDIQDPDLKIAEVYVHLGMTEEAAKAYRKADRRDLAIDMHKRMNEWFPLLRILQQESVGDDEMLKEAFNKVGEHFISKLQWGNALTYFKNANNNEMVFKCCQMLDDYVGIEELAKRLPDGHPLLPEIGECFGYAGLSDQAVTCYLRCDKLNEALDVCIQLNQWEKATNLSKQYKLRDVDSLLSKNAAEFTKSGESSLAAVQLYRRAGKLLDAAKIVFEIADDERQRGSVLARIKKLYVLGATLIEEYHVQNRMKASSLEENGKETDDRKKGAGFDARVALSGLLNEDTDMRLEDSRMIDKAWRGAEAYHFFMMAHQQLYNGDTESAMKTALFLTEFDDILDPLEVYSLLALASAGSRQFAVCSRAFMKLESLPDLSTDEKEAYARLALKIFIKYPPTDSRPAMIECPGCEGPMPDYSFVCPNCDMKIAVCVATGRPLHAFSFWLCPQCKHRAYEQPMSTALHCPLCHAEVA